MFLVNKKNLKANQTQLKRHLVTQAYST